MTAIRGIGSEALQRAYEQGRQTVKPPGGEDGGFARRLAELVDGVDRLQDHASSVQQQFMVGESVDVHDVMIATEEAGLAFSLMVEVRNKLVEAYQDLMRMQV